MTTKAVPQDEVTQRRIAENEAMFRQANERIESFAETSIAFPQTETIGFICECGNVDCDAHLYLTHEQYEALRRNPLRFAVLPGHVMEGAEKVGGGLGEAIVVEKVGSAAKQVVLSEDPRT